MYCDPTIRIVPAPPERKEPGPIQPGYLRLNTMSKRFLRLANLFALAALGLWAQQDRGTFGGTVTDASGAFTPGIKVVEAQVGTNATNETFTNDTGSYRVPNLPIGEYRIEEEAQGFKKSVRDGSRLSVTNVLCVDFTLEVGATTESITVTGEIPLLVTDNPEVGTLMDNRTVIDLPLGFSGGRYAENFATSSLLARAATTGRAASRALPRFLRKWCWTAPRPLSILAATWASPALS